MATLTDIVNRFKTLVEASTTIKSFAFDDLTEVNADRDKTYPLLLLKPPVSRIADVTKPTGTLEDYDLRMYIMTPFHQADREVMREFEKWNELKAIGIDFIQSLQDRDTYKMPNARISTTLGHYQHNDDLMVVGYEFSLTVHNCY